MVKSSVGLAKNPLNESEKKSEKVAKSLKWLGTFIVKSSVGLRRKNRNFYSCEKFRRTRKEFTNESEKIAKSLKWPDTFIAEKFRRTRKKTRNFYSCEMFRRTRKELTNESEKTEKNLSDRELLLWKVPSDHGVRTPWSDSEEKPRIWELLMRSSISKKV